MLLGIRGNVLYDRADFFRAMYESTIRRGARILERDLTLNSAFFSLDQIMSYAIHLR